MLERVRVPLAPTAMAEFLREAVGVEGRELSEELALNSSELRLSEASLRPLLMELLSSQLRGRDSIRPLLSPMGPTTRRISLFQGLPGQKPAPGSAHGRDMACRAHGWLQPNLALARVPVAHKPQ